MRYDMCGSRSRKLRLCYQETSVISQQYHELEPGIKMSRILNMALSNSTNYVREFDERNGVILIKGRQLT